MSNNNQKERALTLEGCSTPHGFASLAAAVLSQLKSHGKCFLYLDEEGNVLHKDPETEIATAHVPSLVVDPSAVVEYDERNGQVTVDLKGVQILKYSSLILETDEEEEEWDDT